MDGGWKARNSSFLSNKGSFKGYLGGKGRHLQLKIEVRTFNVVDDIVKLIAGKHGRVQI